MEDYILKIGKLYIDRIETSEYDGETNFVNFIRLTCDPEEAMYVYGYDNAIKTALLIENIISGEVEVIEK